MKKNSTPFKVAYFVSHPIQYQAPLLKKISEQADIDLSVFFLTDISTREFNDAGFGHKIKWDTPLLDGYRHEFLTSEFKSGDFSLNNPKVSLNSVKSAVLSENWDAVWIHGYANVALLYVAYLCKKNAINLMLRGESNLICTSMGKLKTFFIRTLLNNCAALLSIGSDNTEFYKRYGVKQEKIFNFPYAVDNQAFQQTIDHVESAALNDRKTVLLYASKFIRRKNPVLLITAFSKLDPALVGSTELWFIGDGEQRPAMEDAIKEHKLEDSVKLLGFKNQNELPKYFNECDLFILPSSKEPFGLVINEVMNQAKPIITTNEVGAAIDLVKEDVNGWVVNANSEQELTGAMTKALINAHKLKSMGQNSLTLINKWSFEQNIDGLRQALHYVSSR